MKRHLQDAVEGSVFMGSKLKKSILAASLAMGALCATPAEAQINFRPSDAVNTVTSYVDLGTNGTAITLANNDSASSAALNIGFTFNYNGQSFTQFTLNANGLIKLGSTPISGPSLAANFLAAPDSNVISPASGVDLKEAANQTANPTEFRYHTTGTAGSRVTTIQFKNLADKASGTIPAQFETMNFQIKLYEGTNNIEFVYGRWTANTNTPTGQNFMIGLKGTTGNEIDRLFAQKTSSATPWTTTTFSRTLVQGGVSYIPPHFVRNTFLPDSGRTYRFVPYSIPANDLSVEGMYAPGKVALESGSPMMVQAAIKNVGSAAVNNRTVNLTVSGANSYTASATVSLAIGQDTVIMFAPFVPTTAGNNFVEVVLPSDDINTNNVKDQNVIVTTNTISNAIYPTSATTPVTVTSALRPVGNPTTATEGALLSRFDIANHVDLTSVRIYIPQFGTPPNSTNNIGQTVYATVRDSAGVEIVRSADLVITTNDVNKFVTFTFPSNPRLNNEEIYVGLVVPANTSSPFFPLATQALPFEVEGFFYNSTVAGATVPNDFMGDDAFLIEADVDMVTGVKEELVNHAVSVYPNPSNGVFFVMLNDEVKSDKFTVEVRNIHGQLVHSQESATTNAALNLSKLSAGVYMLHINTNDKAAVKRIVIQ